MSQCKEAVSRPPRRPVSRLCPTEELDRVVVESARGFSIAATKFWKQFFPIGSAFKPSVYIAPAWVTTTAVIGRRPFYLSVDRE
jgi:hypothetical protein